MIDFPGAGDTILLFDLKGNWNRRKRLVLERGSVLTIFYHNGSVWLELLRFLLFFFLSESIFFKIK